MAQPSLGCSWNASSMAARSILTGQGMHEVGLRNVWRLGFSDSFRLKLCSRVPVVSG